MPAAAGNHAANAALPAPHGRVAILAKRNTRLAVFGHNADPGKRGSVGVKQEHWIEGVFSGTHGAYWDADGNLYVQDWNVSGRIMKLVRVRKVNEREI